MVSLVCAGVRVFSVEHLQQSPQRNKSKLPNSRRMLCEVTDEVYRHCELCALHIRCTGLLVAKSTGMTYTTYFKTRTTTYVPTRLCLCCCTTKNSHKIIYFIKIIILIIILAYLLKTNFIFIPIS